MDLTGNDMPAVGYQRHQKKEKLEAEDVSNNIQDLPGF